MRVDLESGTTTRLAAKLPKPTTSLLHAGGAMVFLGRENGPMHLWDTTTGRTVQAFEGPRKSDGTPGSPGRPLLSPDGRQVAFVSPIHVQSGQFGYRMGSLVRFFDVRTGRLLKQWQTRDAEFTCGAYSPDGRFLLVAGDPLSGGPADPAKWRGERRRRAAPRPHAPTRLHVPSLRPPDRNPADPS